jgi:hypothetical protein
MRATKFFLEAGTVEVVYMYESLGFGETFSSLFNMNVEQSEIYGFSEHCHAPWIASLEEDMEMSDSISPLDFTPSALTEIQGLYAIPFDRYREDIPEVQGFTDTLSLQSFLVELNENMGFLDSRSNVWKPCDFHLTWKTRTEYGANGYGGTEYGAIMAYGEDTADVPRIEGYHLMVSFVVIVTNTTTDTEAREDQIFVGDYDNPDDDAEYTYTATMNVTDNGYFEPYLKFEVFQYYWQVYSGGVIIYRRSQANELIIEPMSMG